MRRNLIGILVTLFLITTTCLGQSRGPVRPAGKGAKVGALNKDYVALPKVYVFSQTNAVGLVVTEALPAGAYRIKYEDDAGYYLPAPAPLGAEMAGSIWQYDGGLYVRKNKPTVFYVYAVSPEGKIEPPGRKLPWDFFKQLKQ